MLDAETTLEQDTTKDFLNTLKNFFKHQTLPIKYFYISCPHCQDARDFCTNRSINQTLYRVCKVCERPYTVHIFPNAEKEKVKYEL